MTLAVQSAYLHFHTYTFDGERAPQFPPVEEAKQKILDVFLERVAAQQSAANAGKDFNNPKGHEQIKQFLKEVSSDGVIGEQISKYINEMQFMDGKSMIETGSGFGQDVFVGEGSGKQFVPDIPESAVNILRIVAEKLDNIIRVLADTDQAALVAELFEVRKEVEGQPIPPDLQGRVANGTQLSTQQYNLASVELDTNIANIESTIAELQQIGDGSQVADSSYLWKLMGALRGDFSKVGGHLNEVAFEYIFNAAISKGNRELVGAANRVFAANGWKFLGGDALRVGDTPDPATGQKTKGDVSMTFNMNGVTFVLDGSLKLRQSQRVLAGGDIWTGSLQGHSSTLGDMLLEGFSLSGIDVASMQGFESGLTTMAGHGYNKDGKTARSSRMSAKEGSGAELNKQWNDAKEYSKYALLLRQLTGSGNFQNNDLASIFIVNDKIYSMYGLLERIKDNFDKVVSMTGLGTNDTSFTSLRTQFRQKIRNKFKTVMYDPSNQWPRHEFSKGLLEKLYNRKIKMDINLSLLMRI